MGTAEQLGSLAAFLAALATNPDGTAVAAALIAGPLEAFGATGVQLSRYDGTGLEVVDSAGRQGNGVNASHRISIDDDRPSTRAFLEQMPIIGDGGALSGVVAFPLVAAGTAVGVAEFRCREQHPWSSLDLRLLDALGAAIGMWLTAGATDGGGRPAESVHLSARQRRILTCVLRGRTNAAIASSLGYSDSTIKQDISRAMQHLGAATHRDAAIRAADLGLLDGSP